MVFAVVLLPSSGWANTTTNCPTEPKQGVPIVSGETYSGSNCLLKTTGDVDSFTFTAAAGNTWRIVAGLAGSVTANICLNVYAPGSTGSPIFTGCTGVGFGGPSSVKDDQVTASAGTYTVIVTESSNANQLYALSLERINPPPLDAKALTLAQSVTSQVAVPTAQNPFTFYAATTGTYEVAASYLSGPDNVCFDIFGPGATAASPSQCTGVGFGGPSTIQATFTPKQTGTYLVIIHTATNDSTANYNLEVTCFLGTCPNGPPKCSLTDVPTYDATTGTLTMTFSVGTPVAVTWNGWLSSQNTTQSLWSQSLAITEPSITVTKTQTSVAKAGKVGILSTLTTATGGITCSSWATVNTGKP